MEEATRGAIDRIVDALREGREIVIEQMDLNGIVVCIDGERFGFEVDAVVGCVASDIEECKLNNSVVFRAEECYLRFVSNVTNALLDIALGRFREILEENGFRIVVRGCESTFHLSYVELDVVDKETRHLASLDLDVMFNSPCFNVDMDLHEPLNVVIEGEHISCFSNGRCVLSSSLVRDAVDRLKPCVLAMLNLVLRGMHVEGSKISVSIPISNDVWMFLAVDTEKGELMITMVPTLVLEFVLGYEDVGELDTFLVTFQVTSQAVLMNIHSVSEEDIKKLGLLLERLRLEGGVPMNVVVESLIEGLENLKSLCDPRCAKAIDRLEETILESVLSRALS